MIVCIQGEREIIKVTHNLVSYLSIPHPFHFSPVLYCIERNKILQFVLACGFYLHSFRQWKSLAE